MTLVLFFFCILLQAKPGALEGLLAKLISVEGVCSLRKHPFLLALRRWGRFARNVPAAKSEEKRMFSQARASALSLFFKAKTEFHQPQI